MRHHDNRIPPIYSGASFPGTFPGASLHAMRGGPLAVCYLFAADSERETSCCGNPEVNRR